MNDETKHRDDQHLSFVADASNENHHCCNNEGEENDV